MLQYAIKIAVTCAAVIAVTELSKRSTLLGALVASLPVTSLLAFVWLYWDTGDAGRVAELSIGILWLAVASLPFFVAFPVLVRAGMEFWPSLGLALLLTAVGYAVMASVLRRLGVGT